MTDVREVGAVRDNQRGPSGTCVRLADYALRGDRDEEGRDGEWRQSPAARGQQNENGVLARSATQRRMRIALVRFFAFRSSRPKYLPLEG